jgi:hypothetical protein
VLLALRERRVRGHALAPARLDARAVRIASPCLAGRGDPPPGGFLLGGLVTYGGDPGSAYS